MLPIQRSTPAEGSVGGVGGRIHDYLEAAGPRDDEQGPLFRPIRNNRTGRAYRRQNQLDPALQELGRIKRTLFMLDRLESPELRRRCHAGLN